LKYYQTLILDFAKHKNAKEKYKLKILKKKLNKNYSVSNANRNIALYVSNTIMRINVIPI
jgi:hypothetical protein